MRMGHIVKALWHGIRWSLAAVVVAGSVWLLVMSVQDVPGPRVHWIPFEIWYGNWRSVLITAGVFTVFVVAFTWPRRRLEWRNAGLAAAFFISLFTEMFGIPLTVYLLASLLDLPPWMFGHGESHLWAYLLDRLGLLPLAWGVYLVMVVSVTLIAVGASLVVVGWATVYRGRDRLVTWGIYRHLRHPQYLGLILIVAGFNIQWPTLPTLLMAPLLVVMYVRLAGREDEELATVAGEAFLRYAARTPALVPWRRGRLSRKVRTRTPLTPPPTGTGTGS